MRSFVLLALLVATISVAFAQECPYGLVNDSYPGSCARYTDANENGICDFSELPSGVGACLEPDVANSQLADSLQAPTETGAQEPVGQTMASAQQAIDLTKEKTGITPASKYVFNELAAALVILYAASFALSRKKIISIVLHRRIWNIALLISAVISGVLGLLLVIRINTGLALPMQFEMLYWHVEAGIAMSFIAAFHIAWHWPYFKSTFRQSKS